MTDKTADAYSDIPVERNVPIIFFNPITMNCFYHIGTSFLKKLLSAKILQKKHVKYDINSQDTTCFISC